MKALGRAISLRFAKFYLGLSHVVWKLLKPLEEVSRLLKACWDKAGRTHLHLLGTGPDLLQFSPCSISSMWWEEEFKPLNITFFLLIFFFLLPFHDDIYHYRKGESNTYPIPYTHHPRSMHLLGFLASQVLDRTYPLP